MFKTCCGDCGECWYVGNPRTCTCPDETTKRTWVGLTEEELCEIVGVSTNDSDWNVYKVQEWLRKVEAKLKDKNNG
jgi:hypothetical protein